jgi:hypothetical protein
MSPHRHAIGINRRELLQVGYSALLGLGLSSYSQARANKTRTNQVLIIFLTGAGSHHETFDPKPNAPVEIRGEFATIPTRTPGLLASEHLPLLASRSDKYAIIRSLAHGENNHLVATHHILTGHQQPGAFFDKIASRDDWPSYSSTLNALRPRSDGIPSGVNLPTFLQDGPLVWPGQYAGFLGPRNDPWQITADPNRPDFKVDNLRPTGMDVDQLSERRTLLERVNRQQQWLAESAEGRKLSDQQDKAFSMLTSGQMAKAFDLKQESPAVRDRYGRHTFGQSVLLGKRLIEAGVPVVQVNMGRVQNWDNHAGIFNRLKKDLLPKVDQCVSALLDDLQQSGLLETTFVMMVGEFGRTPKVNKEAGRDHWAACFSGLFAGAGVRGGQVIGKSDSIGSAPITTPYSPDDIGATVYHLLGIEPDTELRDKLNRPVQLNRGQVIRGLFTG